MLIDVFSDLVCPWCYIGNHRLSQALAERPRLRATRRWHPFLLNPDLPRRGIDRNLYLAIRFGSRERARQVQAVVEETARRDGLPLNLNRILRTPNTLNAHRLVALAAETDAAERPADRPPEPSAAPPADRLTGALFAAYFVDGLDIGDPEVLLALATAAGLDPDRARACLKSDGDKDLALFQAETQSHQFDLHAVPCFIFDRRFVLAGAQEPAAFLPLLDLAVADAGLAA
jgi:predicted DsbA family dithiol-disulfide isomerase